MTAPGSVEPTDQAQNPVTESVAADVPATAPVVGNPGAPRRFPSTRFLRDVRLPHALQNPLYRKYWWSQVVSLSGTWMQNVGSSLVVLSLTTSAVAIGALNVAAALPLLIFGLAGGVMADRRDRRTILMVTQGLIALYALAYAVLIWTDVLEYWHIVALAVLAGTTAAYQLPASQAFVPELVDREDLPEAIALNSAVFNATRIVGPAFAATAIAAFGLASAFLINAAALLISLGILMTFRGLVVRRPKPPKQAGTSALKVGVAYVRGREDLIGLVLLTAVLSFLVFPNAIVLMPLYIKEVLGSSDSWVGIMLSVIGVGSLAGSFTLLRGSKLEEAAGRRMRISLIGLVVGLVWLAVASNPYVAIPGVAILGYSFTLSNSQIQTRVQQIAPDDLRGRVLSIVSLAFNGVMPFATIIVSGAAELFGQPVVLGVCAVLTAIGSWYLWRRFAWQAFVPEADATGRVL
ncbi:MAG TPA: MFS transporter [Thermomicrobiales bacterium]|nr:MFS transporter [Thermomicrobiales bacterium]